MKKFILFSCVTLILTLFFAGSPESSFDHSKWNSLLQKHVSSNGNVDYEGFSSSAKELDLYLGMLMSKSPTSSWSKNETKAYWINAYNAFTVKLILKNYPVKSIMKINNGKAWDLKFIEIDSKSYSLNNIEHDILRKTYEDPRIHFAVNCASVSCPKLRNSAFSAEKLDAQMDEMSHSFINNESKNSLSTKNVKISQLFNWYKGDFTKNGSIIDFINKYANEKVAANASIQFKEYNWSLNN